MSSVHPPRIYIDRMTLSHRSGLILTGAAILTIAALLWCLFLGDSPKLDEREQPESRRRVNKLDSKKHEAHKAVRKGENKGGGVPDQRIKGLEKPDFTAEIGDDKLMTAKMRKIFKELQDALDLEQKKRVIEIVQKIQLMDEWPDDIPREVKLKALDALAWFGSDGFAEAVGFLADGDAEVVQAATEKFEEMLSDFDLGDVRTSEILCQLTKVVHDRDALDSFYTEMNNMRDTVKAKTALAIYDSGNEDAIAVLEENLDFIFSDIDNEAKTREDIENFLKKAEQVYKDDPEKAAEDEDFYGPPKD